MPKKPTRKDEWNNEAVALLRRHKTHEQRTRMTSTDLFGFWAEHQRELSVWPGGGDPWQQFHVACNRYIGENAYH